MAHGWATWLWFLGLCVLGIGSAHGSDIFDLVRADDVESLRRRLTKDSDLLNKKEPGTGQTPLMAATLAGAASVVEVLLEMGADHTIPEKDGYTPMHGAGFQGRWKVAQTLLKAGLDTSDRHMDGYTPLHRACWGTRKGHTQTVRVLLDHGVDIEEMDERGRTCLHMTQNDGTRKLIEKRLRQMREKDDL